MNGLDTPPSLPAAFNSLILQDPFVQELIIENELMLAEISRLRKMCVELAGERWQHLCTTEKSFRQQLLILEGEEKLEIITKFQSFLFSGIREVVEELQELREVNAAMQSVMLTVQEELGPNTSTSPISSIIEETNTPARIITAVDLGNKLQINYAGRRGSNELFQQSPRSSIGGRRKRGRGSEDGGWLFSVNDNSAGDDRSVSQHSP